MSSILQIAALAVVVLLGSENSISFPKSAPNQGEKIKRTAMFEVFEKIESQSTISPARAGEILRIGFKPAPAESNQYLTLFHGSGPEWKDAELRLPAGGNGSRFVLVLTPANPIPMQYVVEYFGSDFKVLPPNPSAGTAGYAAYSYRRKDGNIVFSFRNFDQFNAEKVMIDRMN